MGRGTRVGGMSLRRPIAAPATTESRLHRVLATGLRLVAPEEAPLREEAPTAAFGAPKSAIQKHKAPKETLVVEKQRGEEKQEEEEEEEEETGEEGLGDAVRLLVLDFDGTMTRGKCVAAGKEVVAASSNLAQFKEMTPSQHFQNFGGRHAVNEMRKLFERVLAQEIEMRILSYGKKEAIVIALEAVGLAEYFTSTIEGGEGMGDRVYGTDVEPLTDPEATKGSTISEWMEEFELESHEVAFLDDQKENVFGEGVGVSLILDAGHAVLHEGRFDQSQPWIELICDLPEAVAPEAGSDDEDEDDEDDFDAF